MSAALIDYMKLIEQLTNEIHDYVSANPPSFMQISSLPQYSKADELSQIIHNTIPSVEAENPLKELSIALHKKYVDGDESSRLLKRWSGCVIYDGEEPELQMLIGKLNDAKWQFKFAIDEFGKTVSKLPKASASFKGASVDKSQSTVRDLKWEYIHNIFQMLVTLYVYRNVHFSVGPIKAAYWNWLRANNTKKYTKKELEEFLYKQINSYDLSDSFAEKREGLESMASAVAASKTNLYIRKLQQPPRPSLTLHFHDDRRPKPVYGGLPVFIFGQEGLPYNYHALKSFDLSTLKDRKPRTDMQNLKHYIGEFYVAG